MSNEREDEMLSNIPRYEQGVALTEEGGTWYVVTDSFHPYGADVVGYPTYRDAYKGWKTTVNEIGL